MIRASVRLAAVLLALQSPTWGADPEAYCSPTDLVAWESESLLIVADATGHRVLFFDLNSDVVVREVRLPLPPSGLTLSGSTLYVTGEAPDGVVYVIEASDGSIQRTLKAGHMPRAPVVSRDQQTLCVLNRFQNLARFIDLGSGEATDLVALAREPIDAQLTPDGKTLVIAQHLPRGAANSGNIAAEVSFVAFLERRLTASIRLPNGATSVREVGLSSDGRFALCTHILGRYHNPTTQLVRGWINTNALSILDVEQQTLLATVLLDDVDLGAANPWGVVARADGAQLAVTHSGCREVSLIDWPALLERLSGLDPRERDDVKNQLSFLAGLRRRVALSGEGPRAAVYGGDRLFCAEYYSGTLARVAPRAPARQRDEVTALALGPVRPVDTVRLGEQFFHDATLCFQQWHSCSSCHPDVRSDTLNWDLLNDGLGNPKNTKSLLLAHATPPAMITGIRPGAESAVRAGIRHIQFATRPEQDAVALDEFLKSVRPVPSPQLVNGRLSPAAERGREIFDQALCSRCHSGPYWTGQKLHDLRLGQGRDEGRPMDTPTLIESWRTAPYLHDGRAPDLCSLFRDHNDQDRHGRTRDLSDAELCDLIEYVLSL